MVTKVPGRARPGVVSTLVLQARAGSGQQGQHSPHWSFRPGLAPGSRGQHSPWSSAGAAWVWVSHQPAAERVQGQPGAAA